jgi:hypothetical protein
MSDEKAVTKKTGRRFSKAVLSETKEEVVYETTHVPVKGEKIRSSRRKDHLFDPSQRIRGYTFNRPL